jgi:hypothetical protein
MLMRGGPARWRRGYALHRRRFRTDAWGELEPVFDMEHPDVVVEQGSADAVCWQSTGESRGRGKLLSGAVQGEQGERSQEILQGALFSELALEPWDRLVIGGRVYEVREVQQWPSHRMVFVQRV